MVILVVEDEAIIGMALCLILQLTGHRICGPAESPRRALELARSDPPDVALVDLNLERDGDGIELARVLRDRHGTVCIFVTAQPERANEGRDAAIGVVAKPYAFGEIEKAVEYVAARRAGVEIVSVPRSLELFTSPHRRLS